MQWKRDTHHILKPRFAENSSIETNMKLLRIPVEKQDLKQTRVAPEMQYLKRRRMILKLPRTPKKEDRKLPRITLETQDKFADFETKNCQE